MRLRRRAAAGGPIPPLRGIRTRLLAATSLIVFVGVATTTVVAEAVGPPMFRRLMDRAVQPGGDDPYERAFRDATATSVAVALGASALVALALSWYLSRRVHRSATALANAAAAIANGRYDVRVRPPGLGREFDSVAAAFNAMAQRLGAVEEGRRQMLADLAHEIKTPVAVLEAYMEAFEDGVRTLDETSTATMRDQTRRLTRFSDDVGLLASAELRTAVPGERSPTERWLQPSEFVAAAVAAFGPRYASKGVTLDRVDSGGPHPPLWGDEERLGQVLGNLLDNALRHTESAGVVTVYTAVVDGRLRITVRDTGTGVAPEHLPRLFERFYRADAARDRDHGGSGIGLSIVKAIVQAHHGWVSVHSDGIGTGTAFTVELPVGARVHATGRLEHSGGGTRR